MSPNFRTIRRVATENLSRQNLGGKKKKWEEEEEEEEEGEMVQKL